MPMPRTAAFLPCAKPIVHGGTGSKRTTSHVSYPPIYLPPLLQGVDDRKQITATLNRVITSNIQHTIYLKCYFIRIVSSHLFYSLL